MQISRSIRLRSREGYLPVTRTKRKLRNTTVYSPDITSLPMTTYQRVRRQCRQRNDTTAHRSTPLGSTLSANTGHESTGMLGGAPVLRPPHRYQLSKTLESRVCGGRRPHCGDRYIADPGPSWSSTRQGPGPPPERLRCPKCAPGRVPARVPDTPGPCWSWPAQGIACTARRRPRPRPEDSKGGPKGGAGSSQSRLRLGRPTLPLRTPCVAGAPATPAAPPLSSLCQSCSHTSAPPRRW